MNARVLILTEIYEACRQTTLYLDSTVPSWHDRQFFRACLLRIGRNDGTAWTEFLQRLAADRELTLAVRASLLDCGVLRSGSPSDVEFCLATDVAPLTTAEASYFLRLLNVSQREQAVFAHPWTQVCSDKPYAYSLESSQRFIEPKLRESGEIRYIEMKPGLAGPARIGRVQFSQTRKTIYYRDLKLQSLKGGYKANYYDVKSGLRYWISNCKRDGNDTLYPGVVEVDDDAREEYWTTIRRQPENKHLTRFRSLGKHSKRKPA